MVLQSAPVEELLHDVEREMARLVRGLDSHGDIIGPIAQEHLETGGKRLRARLALAACQALGVPLPAAVAWATACEMAHNATLIHDDVQDGDEMRRGQPTTWVRHGVTQAINAGDLLLTLPYLALDQAAVSAAVAWQLCRALASCMIRVIRGQAMECRLTELGQIQRATYVRTIMGKTGALFELPVLGAALLSGASDAAAARLTSPFGPLGMLFQMQDDVLDLYGNKGRAMRGSDLREGKISALVVEHVMLHPHDLAWIVQILRMPRHATPQAAVDLAIERFRSGGALAAVLQSIDTQGRQACAQVDRLLQPVLEQLVEIVLQPIAHLYAAARAASP